MGTRDTRGPDAWRIVVDLSRARETEGGEIQVSHIRRERSSAAAYTCSSSGGSDSDDLKRYFELTWRLDLTLDPQLSRLTRSHFRIVELQCSPHMPMPLKEALTQALKSLC